MLRTGTFCLTVFKPPALQGAPRLSPPAVWVRKPALPPVWSLTKRAQQRVRFDTLPAVSTSCVRSSSRSDCFAICTLLGVYNTPSYTRASQPFPLDHKACTSQLLRPFCSLSSLLKTLFRLLHIITIHFLACTNPPQDKSHHRWLLVVTGGYHTWNATLRWLLVVTTGGCHWCTPRTPMTAMHEVVFYHPGTHMYPHSYAYLCMHMLTHTLRTTF